MKIQKVQVEGFRLLQNVEISMDPKSTVIVGRNNSGKTSLTDVFDKFIGGSGNKFRIEDFSIQNRAKFFDAKKLRDEGESSDKVIAALPKISLTLTFEFDKTNPDLGTLAPFVIDLDLESTTAIVKVEFLPNPMNLDLLLGNNAAIEKKDANVAFVRILKENLTKAYSLQVFAIDPNDGENRRHFDGLTTLNALLQCDFVRAQRTLDHTKNGEADVIGKLLSILFKTATSPNAATVDQELAMKLKASVQGIEQHVQTEFDGMLKGLLPAMGVLGFPSLNDTELRPETSLNVEALLSDHTKIVYAGADGIHLPEGYNGLGTRNLIYMLLQLESYHKAYRSKAPYPAVHLIFIEEPEAHLHPQMQEVFINQLNDAIGKLSLSYPDDPTWKVQFVITTHSPHVANAATFEAVRYFLNKHSLIDKTRQTKVKDFKKGMSSISAEDQEFLHQYMTLTKCDLYFADKAILVEGTTERVLMPRLCEIADKSIDENNKLARQYVTFVEVGGAYAHIFYPLLDFLELKTLVITDLDTTHPVSKEDKHGKKSIKWEKCPVALGERTSNKAIVEWFKPKVEKSDAKEKPPFQIDISELMQKKPADKVDGCRRIAYQIPQDESSNACARSYEDALVLANPDRFEWPELEDRATEAWVIASELHKPETALRFAITEKNWIAPRYIEEGLKWLSEPPPPPTEISTVESNPKGAPAGETA